MENRISEDIKKFKQQSIIGQIPISIKDSGQYLTLCNQEFQLELKKYQSHHEKLSELSEYDIAILTCSDARCEISLFRDFVDSRILFLQVAGNVVDLNDKTSKTKIDDALKKLKTSGLLINMGHAKCGAVDANAHADHYLGKVSKHVDFLVNLVDRKHSTALAEDDYKANTINQAARLAKYKIVVGKSIHVAPCLFDFTNGEQRLLSCLSEGSEPEAIISFRASGISRLRYASDKKYNLPAQYAHAIVVSDPLDLGRFSNPRIIFNANLNELFCVSAIDESISSDAIASIEYALLKVNGVKDAPHIVILHTDKKVGKKLKKIMLTTSSIIKNKTHDGKLVTLAIYNKETGEVVYG